MITYKVKVDAEGNKEWYLNDKLHREDGPAIEYANGTKKWFLNGELHRHDGPAFEDTNGTKMWYLNGLPHREDGPAVQCSNGYEEWHLNGTELTKQEFNERIRLLKQSPDTLTIDGVIYVRKD